MKVLKLIKTNHEKVLAEAVAALENGKTVVYPTDTSYGLGAAAGNARGVAAIYRIKQRSKSRPIHVLVPSLQFAKEILSFNNIAKRLAEEFLPGAISLVLPLKSKNKLLKKLTGGSKHLGIRIVRHTFAQQLAAKLGGAITATSANPHFGVDSYSAKDVVKQFKNKRYKPDLVIDAGNLKKVKPSTMVKISGKKIEILRQGPIREIDIMAALEK